jgi:MFS family permease
MKALLPEVVARAGRMVCFCPPGMPVEGAERRGPVLLAAGFALSVLSQTLTLGILPLAGLLLAPRPALATLPYMAMLVGAAIATFPASFLLDAFGRRASFALGASHGIAGGLVLAWALSANAFVPFCLGAFWLGIAQGFGLFYRHEAAMGAGAMGRAMMLGVVFGSGALAGIAGPAILAFGASLSPSSIFAPAALAASAVQVLVLALAMFWSPAESTSPVPRAEPDAIPYDLREALAPTVLAAAAWFGMTALMLAAPSAMVACGIPTSGVVGALAWHVVAMYAPGFGIAALARTLGLRLTAVLGLALVVAARVILGGTAEATIFTLGLIVLAVGWSLATAASTLWLQASGTPPRWVLAMHDACLLAAALAGALAAGTMQPGVG